MSYPIYYVPAGDVLPILFSTYDGGTGASLTMTGLAVTDIEVYKDGGVTQRASDAGYTLLDTDGIDFDGVTGIHGFSIDTGDDTDAGFYAVGAWFHVVVSSVTIDGQTVNFIAAAFRIMAAEAVGGKPKVDVDAWLGTAAATPTVAGVPEVDLTHVAGATTNVSALATNVDAILTDTADMQPKLGTPAGASISADIAAIEAQTDDIGTAGAGLTAITDRLPTTLVSGRIDASVGAMASGVVTAAAIAADAIGASELAADAVTEIRSLASGTADSGSTSTMVDAARTEADTDYWKGALIVFTSGTLAGQSRVITAFDAATDTITFAPVTTQAVSTHTYEIWPAGDFLRPTTSGRTLDVSAGGEAGLDWANIGSPTTAQDLSATNIDVDQVVASVSGAVGSVTGLTAATVHSDLDDIQARLPAALVSGRIDASVGAVAAGAITAAAIATGAIDADALAADAIDEILDEQIGDGTVTMREALRVLIAGMAGKLSGAATTTVTIRNVADTADVVVATVDANGNRTATTVTP